MTRPIELPSRSARMRAEKSEPGVHEVRMTYARIKRELRHIQRTWLRPARADQRPVTTKPWQV